MSINNNIRNLPTTTEMTQLYRKIIQDNLPGAALDPIGL